MMMTMTMTMLVMATKEKRTTEWWSAAIFLYGLSVLESLSYDNSLKATFVSLFVRRSRTELNRTGLDWTGLDNASFAVCSERLALNKAANLN